MNPGTWIARHWKIWLMIGLALSTLLMRGLVQAHLAEPAAQALFWLRLRYLSIPQDTLWLLFQVLALYLFSASLFRPLNLQPWQWEEQVLGAERPLKRLAQWIEHSDSAFARYRICQVVSEMAVRQLAARLDRSTHQVKTEILQGRLSLPEDITGYLREGLEINRVIMETGWQRLPGLVGASAEQRMDPRLIATLEFLENENNL